MTAIHGDKLKSKAAKTGDAQLQHAVSKYVEWREAADAVSGRTDEEIIKLVNYLNEYKDAVEPIFDARKNSAQEMLQPTILEEFMAILFSQLDEDFGLDLFLDAASTFIDIAFHPVDIASLVEGPEYTVRRKDHDFVIGGTLNISMTGSVKSSEETLVVPAVAVECKRYLERNMLDECAGTADRVKHATPYCKYFVVAEYLKLDDCRPELTKIDEIYVLRRQRNSDRGKSDVQQNPIHADLVIDLYNSVFKHLKRVWWNPDSALESGKLFDF